MICKKVSRTLQQQKRINQFSCEQCQSIILKNIKIFSQNIPKNNFVINTILKMQVLLNIIFIQELSWSSIQLLPSLKNCEGEELVGIPNHPNQITFSRNPSNDGDLPRVITYINIRLSHFHFEKTFLTTETFHISSFLIRDWFTF